MCFVLTIPDDTLSERVPGLVWIKNFVISLDDSFLEQLHHCTVFIEADLYEWYDGNQR